MKPWLFQLDNEKILPQQLLVEGKLVKESWERRNELINSCGIKSFIGNFQEWLDDIKIRKGLHQILPWLSNDEVIYFSWPVPDSLKANGIVRQSGLLLK